METQCSPNPKKIGLEVSEELKKQTGLEHLYFKESMHAQETTTWDKNIPLCYDSHSFIQLLLKNWLVCFYCKIILNTALQNTCSPSPDVGCRLILMEKQMWKYAQVWEKWNIYIYIMEWWLIYEDKWLCGHLDWCCKKCITYDRQIRVQCVWTVYLLVWETSEKRWAELIRTKFKNINGLKYKVFFYHHNINSNEKPKRWRQIMLSESLAASLGLPFPI